MAEPQQMQVGEAGVNLILKPNLPPTPPLNPFSFLGAVVTLIAISPVTGTRKVFACVVTNDPDTGAPGQAASYINGAADFNEPGPWALQVWAAWGGLPQKSGVYTLVVGASL